MTRVAAGPAFNGSGPCTRRRSVAQLSEFLEDFPTVKAELAIAALEQAKEALS